jgi:hypothetical protein
MEQLITIRVQAKDGMFLGPDSFNGAVITVTDQSTGSQLATGLTSPGDSGKRVPASNANTSPYPIKTPGGNPPVAWVEAGTNTVNFSFNLAVNAPMTLNVDARIPLPPEQGNKSAHATLEVVPGQIPTNNAGFVLEVPGLWVQPEIVADGLQMRIRAKVTMMCGCMINAGSPWVPGDFKVEAVVMRMGPIPTFVGTYPMAFQINSQFYADVNLAQSGEYQIVITAEQISIDNSGIATTSFTTMR